MPEREDIPPGARGVFELPIPVPATIHRTRRAKPERAVLIVRRPLALPCLTEDEASPVASPSFPLPRPTERWAAYPRAATLSWIRHDGARFLRPLVLPDGGPVRLADLDPRIVRWAAGEEEWHDWPYPANKRRLGTRRLDLVEERGLALRSCSVNPDAAHAEAALLLARRLCLVDDALHVPCGEPVLDVVARGLSKGQVTRISVIPTAGPQPDPEVEADVVQTFAGHAAAAASAYAEALASRAGLPALVGAAWELHRPILARDDARDAPGEGLARLVERSRTVIGGLPRPAVEAWLNLRDASERAPTAAEAVSLLRALHSLLPPRSGRLPTLLDWELLRWEGAMECDWDLVALRALA